MDRGGAGAVVVETLIVEKPFEPTKVVAAMATAAPPLPQEVTGGRGPAAPTFPRAERMIIKNAEMELLVADTDVALDSITLLAADYGGYIVSTHTWFEGEFKFATVRLGVPVQEFENVLRRLRGLSIRVLNEVVSGEDVTDQYVDLQSRLTNLQATQARIREFLAKAQTVEEALKVNAQLSQVEAQIEEIQGRMNYLKDRAAYSTINVQLIPERPTPTPTPTPTPVAWRPGKTFHRASGVLTDILKGLADAAIWVTVILGPFLVPLLLIIGLVLWLRRRKRRPTQPSGPPPVG